MPLGGTVKTDGVAPNRVLERLGGRPVRHDGTSSNVARLAQNVGEVGKEADGFDHAPLHPAYAFLRADGMAGPSTSLGRAMAGALSLEVDRRAASMHRRWGLVKTASLRFLCVRVL